ncbi:MAG: aminodeoxychorismate synthase, component I [Nitrospinae bacterium CG11_big_fil_rev_8_21_14_0_20_45_15]|nr:MAG: aminodeoxychorismate synthase, component I [Nitrospinae bacterium CG11_big_fil_rev_8_21_14_0_20_45_15]
MQVFPDKAEFERLQNTSPCFPVIGQLKVPGVDITQLFERLFYPAPYSFLFESCKGPEAVARYSIMGQADGCILTIHQSRAELCNSEITREIPLELAFELLDFPPDLTEIDYAPHFWSGWVGLMSYEANELFESLPERKQHAGNSLPDAIFMETHRPLIYDHQSKEIKIIYTVDAENNASYETALQYIDEMARRIEDIFKEVPPSPAPHPTGYAKKDTDLQSLQTQSEYIEKVHRAKKYIEEGDIYQVNLSQEFRAKINVSSLVMYRQLKSVNPAPFAGLLKLQDTSIISSSPERLVKISGSRIETRPIAGTRPRGKTEEEDKIFSAELFLSEKEKAEHLMLVDLERNDLGRICETGSVKVTDLMFLEQYSHVSHIVSNIQGDLKPGTTIRDIFQAVFPGGTITGCPKIRCMEIINELEPGARGAYTGSFGYIGNGGHLDFNIIIRTFVMREGHASFHVGAGIVADSEPEKEYHETLHKAAALLEALALASQ